MNSKRSSVWLGCGGTSIEKSWKISNESMIVLMILAVSIANIITSSEVHRPPPLRYTTHRTADIVFRPNQMCSQMNLFTRIYRVTMKHPFIHSATSISFGHARLHAPIDTVDFVTSSSLFVFVVVVVFLFMPLHNLWSAIFIGWILFILFLCVCKLV